MLDEIALASFAEWCPAEYLADYYTEVEADERHTLRFLARELKKLSGHPTVLEFGLGPTIHHLLPLCPHVSEIHAADYLSGNLAQVRAWLANRPGAHDWRPFTEYVLAMEGHIAPNSEAISRRETLLRRQLTRLLPCDAARSDPLGVVYRRRYACVVSCYCADSATTDKATWMAYMGNILSLLQPGGFFVTAALRHCRSYRVGERCFPSADVNEADFEALFAAHSFVNSSVTLEVAHVPEHIAVGYDSILLASGFLAHEQGITAGARDPLRRPRPHQRQVGQRHSRALAVWCTA